MLHSSFEAFNARDLSPTTVARSFVPSGKYDELMRPSHALLIGPRGSGKTTLLKMLSLEALRSWTHPGADEYRSRINYTGIFVPADITWGEMVDSLADPHRVPDDCRNALGEIAFGINVMLATVDVFALRLQTPVEPSEGLKYGAVVVPDDVEDLILQIAETWRLKLRSLSFRGLALALQARLADLYSAAKRLSHAAAPDMALLQREIPYADIDLFSSLLVALEAFNRAVGERGARWALLLDEFEVVPAHIQEKVIAGLRASDSRIIFKVALAPCGPQTSLLLGGSAPSRLDDANRIELWYRDKKDAIAFCRKLYDSRSALHGISDDTRVPLGPEDMLGRTLTADPEVDPRTNDELFAPSNKGWASEWSKYFLSLSASDSTFKSYLMEHQIDLSDLRSSPNETNGNRLRKIAPIVAFRAEYRAKTGKVRGRKKFQRPYVGWEAIATISEGNPRWFIGMLVGLERALKEQGKSPVETSRQWDSVNRAMGAFVEKLKTVAIENNIGITTAEPIFRLLKEIGDSFHRTLVTEEFSEDPPSTFFIDEEVPEDIEKCLRIALNFGGIVCYDKPDHLAGFSSLRGKRFRLAYILSPEFKLPLRSGKKRSLTSLLRTSVPSAPVDPEVELQPSLL